MSPGYYWNITQTHISDTACYRTLNDTDPSNIVQKRVPKFADKYKSMITKRKHKMPNLYMLPNYIKTNELMK